MYHGKVYECEHSSSSIARQIIASQISKDLDNEAPHTFACDCREQLAARQQLTTQDDEVSSPTLSASDETGTNDALKA